MKAILMVLLAFGVSTATAEGGDRTWINPADLDAMGAHLPKAGPGSPADSVSERTWINPADLDAAGRGLPIAGPAEIVHYKGCYTTYKTLKQAQRACPPGVVAVRVSGYYASGFTCQCNLDTESGD